MTRTTRRLALALACALALGACGDDGSSAAADTTADGTADVAVDTSPDVPQPLPEAIEGTAVAFDLDGTFATGETFFDFPWPSDLRLTAEGTPAMTSIPNPNELELVQGLIDTTDDRRGFPVQPVAWFRFDAPLDERDPDVVVPASPSETLLLVDIDPDSPDRGNLVPVIAEALESDPYTPDDVLAVAPRQGFILAPDTTYAFVVRRGFGDATGAPLGVPKGLVALAQGRVPEGALGQAAADLYAPLWTTLDDLGVPADDVAAATVFTTGDVVADLFSLTEGVRKTYDAAIADLAIDPDDGADHPRFCELRGTVTFPQFQKGVPSFDTDGLFEIGADGQPVWQRDATVPLVITFPKEPMPAGGYPLVMYFHGSGGLSTQVVDRGTQPGPGQPNTKGEGPSHVLAAHGFGTVGSAHPVNPERVAGAIAIEYLNLGNLKALRDTFRQGVSEQRLLLDALLELEVPPEMVAGCDGMTLPAGESAYRYAAEPVLAMGQSMGGMYTNMVGAVEPRIQAVVPTGAGGFWSYFARVTELLDIEPLLQIALGTKAALSFRHPLLHVLHTSWEPAEPFVYMPRLAHRPLAGHPVRPVYEPIGMGDSYFPIEIFDAAVIAYCHQQAGDIVWPGVQQSLALAGLDGVIDYPVANNRTSLSGGTPFSGVAVQYAGDGFSDPHVIFAQLDEVKHQYGCFFESFLRTGTATVPAPAALGTPCAGIP